MTLVSSDKFPLSSQQTSSVAALSLTNGGTGYTPNLLVNNAPLVAVTGTGAGAVADIQVSPGGVVTFVTFHLGNGGAGYNVGDTLTCNAIGGGTGFVVTVSSLIALTTTSAPSNVAGNFARLQSEANIQRAYTFATVDAYSTSWLKWAMLTTGTESGSNVGCDLRLTSFSDIDGAFLANVLSLIRKTGCVGVGVDDPRGFLSVPANSVAHPTMNFAASDSVPSPLQMGDFWFDGGNFYYYDGSVTKTISTSGGGGGVTGSGTNGYLARWNSPTTIGDANTADNPVFAGLFPAVGVTYNNTILASISTTTNGASENGFIGLFGQGYGSANGDGAGVYGHGWTSATAGQVSAGVIGEGKVSLSTDASNAVGVRGYSVDTHAGADNIGLYGDATGGANNYALKMNRGGIQSVVAQTWTLPSSTGALVFDTNLIVLDTTNARVGIGKASPSYELDVNNDAAVHTVRIGLGAGSVATNTVLGYTALNANTTGSTGVAVGYEALLSNTSGVSNTAVGHQAMRANLGGARNVAIGQTAMYASTGSDNVAVGQGALYSLTSNGANTAVGRYAAVYNTGANNTAIGAVALGGSVGVSTGGNNTAVGYQAGYSLTTAATAVMVGYQAGIALTSASYVTAVGYQSALRLTTGTSITAFGFQSLQYNTGDNNTAIGDKALQGVDGASNGASNTAVGGSSLLALTIGASNTSVGFQSGYRISSASYNTLVGRAAGVFNTGGSNTAVGYQALYGVDGVSVGGNNTAVGYQAGYSLTTAATAVMVGYQAGVALTTATYATAIGYQAVLRLTTGTSPTGVGYQALQYNTGANNTAVGDRALQGVDATSNGGSNTALGAGSLIALTTGANNTAVGYLSGNTITTGSQNVCIGNTAQVSAAGDTNEIVIGYGATGAGSNTTTIGNASTTSTKIPAGTLNLSTVASQGVKLPSTGGNSDVQTLDAYYESTWTATLNTFTTSGTVTATARYTTIGRQVTAELVITTAAASSCTGGASSNVSGLPVYATDAATAALAIVNSTGATYAAMVNTSGVITFANFTLGASDKLKVVFTYTI